ncbi:MAG: hypothetical protein ACP5P9_09900, partial [Acidimicrobiales bacterium]
MRPRRAQAGDTMMEVVRTAPDPASEQVAGGGSGGVPRGDEPGGGGSSFDVVVVGGGPGGYATALYGASAG